MNITPKKERFVATPDFDKYKELEMNQKILNIRKER
jgi:hypothetical protein